MNLVERSIATLWLPDVVRIQPLTEAGELPEGWTARFGSRCRLVHSTSDWPDCKEVHDLLKVQLARLLELFRSEAARLTEIEPDTRTRWCLTRGIFHGLHDEARHQGEMYLLLKLCRARGV
jgi:hypothetical protein